MAAIFGERKIFWKLPRVHQLDTLWVENFDKIALCRTVKQIESKFANLISKLNFYKLIPYPMDNCFTGRRDRSRQTPEKDVLYIIPAGPVSSVHSLGGASYLLPV